MSEALHQELASLRDATRRAVSESYREQERLCRDAEMMQVQISYLKAKIQAAKSELILKGKLNESQTDQVPVIEEERSGEFTASDRTLTVSGEGESIDVQLEELADEDKSQHADGAPTHGRSSSMDSGMPGLSRGSMLSMLRKSTSGMNESLSASARFSLFDEVGMPSRWQARELEKQKQAEQQEDEATVDDSHDTTSGENVNAESEGSGGLLQRVQKLIAQRESEIDVLEKQTKEMEQETTLYHNKISDMQQEHETNMEAAKRERDALLKGIQRMEADNEKLDAMILETGVLFQEKEIGCHLLETELRDARNELYRLQSMEKANKQKTKPSTREPSHVATYSDRTARQVPLNDVNGGEERKGVSRLPRRGSNNSVVSASSMMSALTLDFDDIVDILDNSRRSVGDFDVLLDSLTSNSPID